MEREYKNIKQHCCTSTYDRHNNNISQSLPRNSDLTEIAYSLGLDIPSVSSKFVSRSTITTTALRTAFTIPASSLNNNSNTGFNLSNVDPNKLKLYGKLQLRYAQYCEELHQFNSIPLMTAFRAVTIACPMWEDSHFWFAIYCSNHIKEYQSLASRLQSQTAFTVGKMEEILVLKNRMISSLVQSLKYGTKYVVISLPMLLQAWVESGLEYMAMQSGSYNVSSTSITNGIGARKSIQTKKDLLRTLAENSTKHIKTMVNEINNAVFLLEIDFLIAHMLHPYDEIGSTIRYILAQLLVDFPHHMAWQFSRSSSYTSIRGFHSKEVLRKAIKMSEDLENNIKLSKYFTTFNAFTNCINELAR